MRSVAILAMLALLSFAFVPAAEAHWDRNSDDYCPPDDIRWYFDHVHKSCCTPSWFCPVARVLDVLETGDAPLLP